jgi:hypothetical protein
MSPDRNNHHIVIIPGLNDTGRRCTSLARRVESDGMNPHVFRYPCRDWTIDRTALMLATYVDTKVLEDDHSRSISFVGFGTGSLIMRYYITHYELLPARRCIIIADPFHATDKYRKKKIGWWGQYRFGTIIKQLAGGPRGFSSNCGTPPIPFGVIITNSTLDHERNRLNNEIVRDSIYTAPVLLRAAHDVVYHHVSCASRKATPVVNEFVSTFLQHGWFKES